LDSRKMSLQLLIANHPSCLKCLRNGDCVLQTRAEENKIEEKIFENRKEYEEEYATVLQRDNNLCINCGLCVRYCDEIQSVHAIDFAKRGHKAYVATPFDVPIDESACISCGQCVLHCPTGALNERFEIDEVVELLQNKGNKHVICQVAPSIRVSAGEEFGMEPGTLVTGKIVAALRKMGFDAVFDTDFAADLTIVEEANELVERIGNGGQLPMFTSCCPGWVKFMENEYPDQIGHLSSCKSPQAMHGAIAKTYYAGEVGKKPEDIVMVGIMPCTAKKYEKTRPQLNKNGYQDVNHVITTREFAKLCQVFSIDFTKLEDEEFDNPMGEASGAGDLFGTTGGVMEAALRTAYEKATGKELDRLEFDQIRGYKGVKEGMIHINGQEIRFAVVHSLVNARKIMKEVQEGTSPYQFVEVMACPGGCIGGGGQPRITSVEVINKRIAGLQGLDKMKVIRRSHQNPSIIKLYDEYLGEVGGELAHHLLHTRFTKRNRP
ncbi:MAG: [FeFe] hydrogenase, group A, partial [Nanoarchaeota archaeon]